MEIHKLQLHTRQFAKQKHFYQEVLQFSLRQAQKNRFTIQAGQTELTFVKSDQGFYYHFAFLIPNDSLQEAIDFLKERNIPLLLHDQQEVIDFGTGRAIYFYDPNGNIVEFIERPSLGYPRKKPFSATAVIKVNEIGLPVESPLDMSKQLIETYAIDLVDPKALSDRFCWVGDYNGVFIVTQLGRNWLPTQQPGISNDFWIIFSTLQQTHHLHFVNNELLIWSKTAS